MIHPNNEINFKGNFYIHSSKNEERKNDEIESLIENVSNTKSHKEFHDVLEDYINSNPSADQIGINFIKNGEYYIQSGLTDDIDYLYKKLRLFQKEGCTICPDEIIKASNDNGFSILITRFNSAEEDNLEDYDKNKSKISALSKEKAYKDLAKIADIGFVNTDLLQNGKKLKVVKPTQRIICDDWSDLTPINEYLFDYDDDSSRPDILKNIKKIIY